MTHPTPSEEGYNGIQCSISFNLRGLSTVEKSIKVKCFIQDLHSPLDIFSWQEHKIRKGNIGRLNGIWPQAVFVSSPALDGRLANRNRYVPAGKGGVFFAIGPRLSPSITARGTTPSERAAWVHLDHPTLGKLGVLVAYTPNGRH